MSGLRDSALPGLVSLPAESGLDDHARYDRAVFLFEAKDYVGTARLLEPLFEGAPWNAEIALLLARSYYHAARLGPAEEVLLTMVERWPTDAYAHLLLARALQRAGRAEQGARYLRIAEAMGLEG